MKTKGCLVGAVIGLLVLIGVLIMWGVGIHNDIVPKEQAVEGQWGNVETAYQKRADLTDQLVNTVKGARDFEQETLVQVIEARAKATEVNIDPSNLSAENIAQFQQAQEGLSGALNRLMVVVERYPELKTNENFLSLQSSLEGMADEIRFEQRKFNDAAQVYNTFIKKIPNNLIANFGNFDAKGYFKASDGAATAPNVEFFK